MVGWFRFWLNQHLLGNSSVPGTMQGAGSVEMEGHIFGLRPPPPEVMVSGEVRVDVQLPYSAVCTRAEICMCSGRVGTGEGMDSSALGDPQKGPLRKQPLGNLGNSSRHQSDYRRAKVFS